MGARYFHLLRHNQPLIRLGRYFKSPFNRRHAFPFILFLRTTFLFARNTVPIRNEYSPFVAYRFSSPAPVSHPALPYVIDQRRAPRRKRYSWPKTSIYSGETRSNRNSDPEMRRAVKVGTINIRFDGGNGWKTGEIENETGIGGVACVLCTMCGFAGPRCAVVGMLSAAGSRVAHCYSSGLAFAASLPFLRRPARSFARSFVRFRFKTILPWPLCTCGHSAGPVCVRWLSVYAAACAHTYADRITYLSGGRAEVSFVVVSSRSCLRRASRRAIRQLSRVISNGHERAPCAFSSGRADDSIGNTSKPLRVPARLCFAVQFRFASAKWATG